ncbi:MAG: hypothetical protein M0R76_13140 [Proteobacteria bacterium]|nr:hypothetical protein [Pseudomonadota bacterium]
MRTRHTLYALIFSLVTLNACKTETPGAAATEVRLPNIKENSGHFVFSWFEDGQAHTARSIAEIPEEMRREVRVQDPTIPPGRIDPDIVFIADLRTPNSDGLFPVSAVPRQQYNAQRSPASGAADHAPALPTAAAADADVTLYATDHCPHCHRARRWLLEQKIPYREINVEKDAAAAKSLTEKGQAQGVPTTGFPIFEIRGQLLPGFDPDALLRTLAQPATPPQTPPTVTTSPSPNTRI